MKLKKYYLPLSKSFQLDLIYYIFSWLSATFSTYKKKCAYMKKIALYSWMIKWLSYHLDLARWGKTLNLDNLTFARIEPFKWCMWSFGIFPGPSMSEERLELAKAVSFTYIIDDIFDSCGRYDELYLFTKAINRYANTSSHNKCISFHFREFHINFINIFIW